MNFRIFIGPILVPSFLELVATVKPPSYLSQWGDRQIEKWRDSLVRLLL